MRPHGRDLFLDAAGAQLAAVPAGDQLQPVLAEHGLDRGRVVGELAALLDALEAGLGRLLQAGLERRLAAELRHVVVGPGDRVGPELDRHLIVLPQPIACAARALTYSLRASFTCGRGEVSGTATSHHAPPASVVGIGSVSITTT